MSTSGRKCAPVFSLLLTFILEDVLSVGQHTGEGATQKQPQACGPHKQEDDIVGEDKQHQECHHHSHLSQQRQRQLDAGASQRKGPFCIEEVGTRERFCRARFCRVKSDRGRWNPRALSGEAGN